MAPRYPAANTFGTFLKTMNDFKEARSLSKTAAMVDAKDVLRVVELLSESGGSAPLRDVLERSNLGRDGFLRLLQSEMSRDLFRQRENGDTVELELTTLGRQFAA